MTKLRMTKAQKLAQIEQETVAYAINLEALEPCKVEAGPALDLEQVLEDTWTDPIKWVDETPTLEVDELYVPLAKPMKKVKTVKTGVGAQILYLIAEGVLSNKEIVAKVLEDNPLRKTTYACVAWYKSQVAAGKIDLPQVEEETTEE